MKLVCLNLWGGAQGPALFDFLKQQSQDADIFCFQEVFSLPKGAAAPKQGDAKFNLYGRLADSLKDFTGYFAPTSQDHDFKGPVDFKVNFGSAVFVKNSFKAFDHKVLEIFGKVGDPVQPGLVNVPRAVQQITVSVLGKNLNVLNYHGIPHPGHKMDTKERLKQSEKIMGFIKGLSGEVILCGDFNLMPNTQSIKIIEQNLKNLIAEYKIENTRNELVWKGFADKQHFADYMFVSTGIRVNSFAVPYMEVSDHLPLIVEFELSTNHK